MNKPFQLGLVMDTGLGWRTNYQNWRAHFPQDMNVQPSWIVLSHDAPHWIDKAAGVPPRVKAVLRHALMLREGLKQGPFDATFIAASSAQMTLPRYMKKHPSFLYIDATFKQLFEFGGYYYRPDKNPRVAARKHQRRVRAYQSARGIFSTSQWAADSAVADYGVRRQNTHVLPFCVDTRQWRPGDPALKAGKDVCDLLFVGGDFARKGGPLLLDWAARTQASGWRLHLVTPQAVETQDPRVCVYNDLTPNDPRLRALYAQADVFVLPTKADCYSIAGVEALASGLPVVLGQTGGTGEVVRPETGFLIAPEEAGALSQSLETLIRDSELRTRMGAAGRADAEQRFDAAKLVREAVQVMIEKS